MQTSTALFRRIWQSGSEWSESGVPLLSTCLLSTDWVFVYSDVGRLRNEMKILGIPLHEEEELDGFVNTFARLFGCSVRLFYVVLLL
jgi:hypothetical protein